MHRSRTNTHGIRKGTATFSASGTTVPPSLISVVLRGKSSMGKVFDDYFNFGECEDNYLGPILVGLDQNDKIYFGDLPPHFEKNVDYKIIEKGMTCILVSYLGVVLIAFLFYF